MKADDQLDSCECGDYRRDHPNGGPCNFNDGKICRHGYGGDGHFGAGACFGFRLQQTRAQELAAIEKFTNHNVVKFRKRR